MTNTTNWESKKKKNNDTMTNQPTRLYIQNFSHQSIKNYIYIKNKIINIAQKIKSKKSWWYVLIKSTLVKQTQQMKKHKNKRRQRQHTRMDHRGERYSHFEAASHIWWWLSPTYSGSSGWWTCCCWFRMRKQQPFEASERDRYRRKDSETENESEGEWKWVTQTKDLTCFWEV